MKEDCGEVEVVLDWEGAERERRRSVERCASDWGNAAGEDEDEDEEDEWEAIGGWSVPFSAPCDGTTEASE